MVRINLLPWRQRRRERARRVFLAQLLVSFVVAAVLVVVAEIHVHGLIEQQRQRNLLLVNHGAELDAEIAEIDGLNRRSDELLARVEVLQALWEDRSTTVEVFEGLARSVVAGLHFVALSRRGDALVAHGAAESNDRVAALMRNLRDSPRFAAPNLKNIGGHIDPAYGEHSAPFELLFTVASADDRTMSSK